MTTLLLLLGALAAPAGAAEGPSFGAGGAATAGSGGYWKVSATGDAQWEAKPWLPYAWSELSADRYANRFAMGGGTWRELDADLRVKGGLSFSAGRFRGAAEGSRSVTIETGVERALGAGAAGGEYLFTSGALGGRRVVQSVERNRGGQVRVRRVDAAGSSFTNHELSAYGRLPAGETTVGLRLTLDLPSTSENVLSETLSWRLPVAASSWLTPALTVEHDHSTDVILALAFYHLFG